MSVSGGGTVSSGGLNQTFNTLAVNGYGVFDLGSTVAVSNSTFADSSSGGTGALWTASAGVGPLLRINSWVGSPGSAGTKGAILGSGTTWLTSTQLSEVHFTGYTTGAQILGSGELVPVSSATVLKLGDINQDLHVNASDIVAMMSALSNLDAYDTAHSFDFAELNDVADVNGDGVVTNADLQALINYEKTGHGSESVPEPASFVLLGAGSALVFVRRVRKQRKQS